MSPPSATPALLSVRDLRVGFPTRTGLAEAVRGVDFDIAPGEAHGLVGESGSGKSLTAMAVMQLIAPPGRIIGGSAMFGGVDLLALDEAEIRARRGRDISMVFQDPSTSLNPAFSVGQQLVDAIRTHRTDLSRRAARERAAEVLGLVGVPSPSQRLGHYPHEFSGGMRQRVLIALAIACEPRLLIADEPTTALDVTVQARIVDLLNDLRERLNLAILFISHNLDLVAEVCDRVGVMYAGRIVETGDVRALFRTPSHPYTRMLQRCVPRIDDEDTAAFTSIVGSPPGIGEMPSGCAFAPRCPKARERCRAAYPTTRRAGAQTVACWEAS